MIEPEQIAAHSAIGSAPTTREGPRAGSKLALVLGFELVEELSDGGKRPYAMSARTAEVRRMADTSAGLKARYFK